MQKFIVRANRTYCETDEAISLVDNVTSLLKWCPQCFQFLPRDCFGKNSSEQDGLQSYCKSCESLYRKLHLETFRLATLNWERRNRDKVNMYERSYERNNRTRDHENDYRRLSRLRDAYIEPVDFEEIAVRDLWICQLCLQPCLREEASLDHRIPLSRGGTHEHSNVQLAHLICNQRKWAKMPDEVIR